jgi:phage repressor protein C with HTH and peptisase S24 domain
MKKDYSQSFNPESNNVFLLIENEKTHKFALHHPRNDDGVYSYRVPRIDMRIKADVPSVLIKAAREYGISLSRFSELGKETVLLYSFIDKARGSKIDVLCMHLKGDAIENTIPNEDIVFVDIHDAVELLESNYGTSDFVCKTIKRLASEYERPVFR